MRHGFRVVLITFNSLTHAAVAADIAAAAAAVRINRLRIRLRNRPAPRNRSIAGALLGKNAGAQK